MTIILNYIAIIGIRISLFYCLRHFNVLENSHSSTKRHFNDCQFTLHFVYWICWVVVQECICLIINHYKLKKKYTFI